MAATIRRGTSTSIIWSDNAPGRYADVVLLSDVNDVEIDRVYANGQLAAHAENGNFSTCYQFRRLTTRMGEEYHECGEADYSEGTIAALGCYDRYGSSDGALFLL